jgi:hypothetical protein
LILPSFLPALPRSSFLPNSLSLNFPRPFLAFCPIPCLTRSPGSAFGAARASGDSLTGPRRRCCPNSVLCTAICALCRVCVHKTARHNRAQPRAAGRDLICDINSRFRLVGRSYPRQQKKGFVFLFCSGLLVSPRSASPLSKDPGRKDSIERHNFFGDGFMLEAWHGPLDAPFTTRMLKEPCALRQLSRLWRHGVRNSCRRRLRGKTERGTGRCPRLWRRRTSGFSSFHRAT